ncbi:PREDICTED: uncharacterized protein LOC108559901 [Nicrophorus vespilloides]|uniref:Uncharacterized protein LOC108559901 n=1 Tax=Nicrophorus vespilloides TaxID=110193 RepID=A0ABM1MDW9_NICVS|nr:PREDICTED: uncharacterized protein LOC108559901 [Nicrophorus vespilloides]XP_017772777.1 PREDICTED: uncharacterized protein LOC108559901 [Nicrophorus vespilloides]XP_017772787.1 PREDICTED: uncharacterized protein LOC108559901 [Nicrophorus vespilloides]
MAAVNENLRRKMEPATGLTDDDMEFATFITEIIGGVNPVHKMFLKVMMLIYVNTIHTTRDLRRNGGGGNSNDDNDSASSSQSTRPTVVKTEAGTEERKRMKRCHSRRFSPTGQYAICGNPNILIMSDLLRAHQSAQHGAGSSPSSDEEAESPVLKKYRKMLGKDLRKFIKAEKIPSETEESSSDSEIEGPLLTAK